MKFLLSWLKEYIDVQLPAPEIAERLTSAGLEVDGIESCSTRFQGIVVGRVSDVQKHPNADKLCVATVTDGVESYQVVCGAPNCRAGIKTAFAKVGATLEDDNGKIYKIKKGKLRDVESYGMLCSKKELGLSGEDDGIIEFSDDAKEGDSVAEMYGDLIFEISLTPNLGHCASIVGIARELSAAKAGEVKIPALTLIEENLSTDAFVKVTVEDDVRCPRYACRIVQDVTIAPSPPWMQERLMAAGIRPINNIVDITNYVTLEIGQPLHAFDFDKLNGNEIIVRTAHEGETFTTLDGQERILTDGDLLICDKTEAGSRPIAIAGVMGGLNTEVSESTHHVLLEAAHFQPSAIRRTSKRLGLQTEAARRFERSVDPNAVLWAIDRAAMLMQQLAGGKITATAIDCKKNEFEKRNVSCRLSRVNQLLGTLLGVSEVEDIFDRLEIVHSWDGKDRFELQIPTYRADISAEIDIVEEVARIYGYENIERSVPKYRGSQLPHSPLFLFERQARTHLLAKNLQEFITCDLIGPQLLDVVQEQLMPAEATIKVLNPTSIEQSTLRTSLLPSLLQVVKYNFDHQNSDVTGFEIGRIHFKEKGQYREQSMVGLVMTGLRGQPHWSSKANELDFFDLKGIIEGFLAGMGITSVKFHENDLKTLHPGRQLAISSGGLEIGAFGEVHPAIVKRLDVPQRILFAEINLHDLYRIREPAKKVSDLPLFPSSERDWTVTLHAGSSIQRIFDAIRSIATELLEDVSLIDLYQSDKLGKEIRNATFRFIYRDKEKTIAQAAVDAEHAKIINHALSLDNRS